MRAMKITSKRQATLPLELCEALGIEAGDTVRLERRMVDGESVWVLRGPQVDWSWFGAARRHARGKDHRWPRVKGSIARGWERGDRP
jgi:bifunctional DNA-binding transcriptional regulator/antitoxin component of YhaV-PrlF toxin-antitoxin module